MSFITHLLLQLSHTRLCSLNCCFKLSSPVVCVCTLLLQLCRSLLRFCCLRVDMRHFGAHFLSLSSPVVCVCTLLLQLSRPLLRLCSLRVDRHINTCSLLGLSLAGMKEWVSNCLCTHAHPLRTKEQHTVPHNNEHTAHLLSITATLWCALDSSSF